jgi:hypothetical protein
MNKENLKPAENENKAPVPCKFEELKDEFLIQREIGRGKLTILFLICRFLRSCFQGHPQPEEIE